MSENRNAVREDTEMMSSSSDAARLFLVVGLGVSGWSCVRFLAAQGYRIAVTDSRDITPYSADLHRQLPEVVCSLGGFDSALFDAADEIILSPGVALDTPEVVAARAAGKRIIGDVELFSRYADAPVVAITGSNGKSTVTTLLGEMAAADGVKVAVGGNIGTPALDLLAGKPELYILELSSFQLDLISSLKKETAVVLNVSADHMDRYASMQAYAKTKFSIYEECEHPVIDNDLVSAQQYSPLMSQRLPEIAINYSLAEPVSDSDFGIHEQNGKKYLARGCRMILPISDLALKGNHNIANVLAAMAMASILGLSESALIKTLKTFKGLPHRCQPVGVINKVAFVNDSKGTNVDASIAAIRSISTPLVLIAGGDAKGANLSPLRDVAAAKLRAVIVIGKAAAMIESLLQDVVNTQRASTMADAVQKAFSSAEPGDTVLLSPACSSLDMYSDYEARGDAFADAVRGLSS